MLVRLFGFLREVAKETELELDAASPSLLLHELSARYGPEWDRIVTLPGSDKGFLGIICVNGRCLEENELESFRIDNGDTVMIIPPLKGG
ncbi:MAG: MoaD/ThiS family protein [Thermovirgaceae bacterium]